MDVRKPPDASNTFSRLSTESTTKILPSSLVHTSSTLDSAISPIVSWEMVCSSINAAGLSFTFSQ